MKKILLIPILIVLIPILLFLPQDAHAVTVIDLKDQASCQAAPLIGSWNPANHICTIGSLTLNTGDSLTLDDSVFPNIGLIITGTINNSGSILNKGTDNIINNGVINNNPGGLIRTSDNGGNLTNNSGGTINNTGTINTSFGNINNSGFITNNSGGLITNSFGGIIDNRGTIDNAGTINSIAPNTEARVYLLNKGTINNSGTINTSGVSDHDIVTNDGTLTNAGVINNGGTFNNTGSITNKLGGNINNKGGGIINNNLGGTINNLGLINSILEIANDGVINNSGTINNNLDLSVNGGGGVIINKGTITNNSGGTINNNGDNINPSVVNNDGTITNNSGGTINNTGAITNKGIITNNGVINNKCGGIVTGNPVSGNPVVNFPCNTVITLNPISSVPWNKTVTISGHMADQLGNDVSGASISFTGTGGSSITISTSDLYGSFVTAGTAPLTVQTGWTVQAHFAGNSTFNPSDSNIVTYSTTSHHTSLSLTQPTNVKWGQPTTFVATLLDSDNGGIGISGKSIYFNGTGVLGVANATTGTTGMSTGHGTAPATVKTGWAAEATFTPTGIRFIGSHSPILKFNTVKHPTSLTMIIKPNPVLHNKGYAISGILKDLTTNTGISVKTIQFVTNNSAVVIPPILTNSTGGYTITGLVAPNLPGKSVQIQATYSTQPLYAGATVLKLLKIT